MAAPILDSAPALFPLPELSVRPFRLLVTGGRDAVDMFEVWGLMAHFLEPVRLRNQPIVVVHGKCGGVDFFADRWANRQPNVTPEPHPAEDFGPWPACGPIRNSYMVSLGADLCLAMPTRRSKGTWGCAREAAEAGIEVRLWTVKGKL